jgi:hypothetical protein
VLKKSAVDAVVDVGDLEIAMDRNARLHDRPSPGRLYHLS